MTVIDAAPLPIPCRSCGEPLFTRALVCPHCGAAEPLGEPEIAAPEPVLGFEPLTPRRVVVDVPAAAAQAATPPAADTVMPAEAGPAPEDPVPVEPEVDLAPVAWRSAAAAQAEPLARKPDPTEAAEPPVDDDAAAMEAASAAGRPPAATEPPVAAEAPVAPPPAEMSVPEPAPTIGDVQDVAPPAANGRDVRPPDAQPTVDRFDEIMDASAAEEAGHADTSTHPVGDLHGEIETPRRPTPEARLDIAPRRDSGGGVEPPESGHDLVLVPERGGRALGPPRRRSGARMAAGVLLILLFVAVGAGGALFWRHIGPFADEAAVPAEPTQLAQADPAEIAAGAPREIDLTRQWAPLDLGTPPPGGWSIAASGPFRIRVDGAVYTVSGPVPFAVPLDGGTVEARAVGDAVTLSVSPR